MILHYYFGVIAFETLQLDGIVDVSFEFGIAAGQDAEMAVV
jgi:hypothetical protein